MKLLLFIFSLSSGGAERVTANLANHWAAKGWQVNIVTLAPQSLDFYQLHPTVRRIALGLAGGSANPLAAVINNLRRAVALRRALRQIKPDVAVAMMTTANVLLALAAIGLQKTVCIGSERSYPPQSSPGPFWEGLRARVYGRLAALVALTHESAEWLRQHTNARVIPVIPNAVPWPLTVQKPKLAWPAALKGRRVLLAVGRLSAEKQYDLLIRVFHVLAEGFPDWMLVILGEGSDRQALEAQVETAGLRERVLFPGRAGNVGQWYEAADLYVMSSRFEGFPNTLAEAMAHRLPAVSFDCDTGPRDIIRHGVDGLLVPAGDERALEAALRRMMDDEPLRQQMAGRAIEVRERFSMEKVAEAWEQVFYEAKR